MRGGRALVTRLVSGAALAVIVVTVVLPASAFADSPCPDRDGAGWTLSTNEFSNISTRHAYVGNGYLSQRVPAAGMGYLSTGEKTGWPLYTPRYDGAFVAGLYGADPAIESGRTIDSAIPTWSTLALTAGSETYSPTTPAGEVSNYSQTLYLGCGLLRTSLTWTTADGRATDLVYDVVADRADPRVGAVRMTMVPHWSGPATVTDTIDGDGARRLVQTGGGTPQNPGPIHGRELRDSDAGHRRHGGVDARGKRRRRGQAEVRPDRKKPDRDRRAHASRCASGRSYELHEVRGRRHRPDLAGAGGVRAGRVAERRRRRAGRRCSREHVEAWADLWNSDITVGDQPDLQDWIRANLYDLLVEHPRRHRRQHLPVGLSSDNYAGLIFWDAETWMYPSLLADASGHRRIGRSSTAARRSRAR